MCVSQSLGRSLHEPMTDHASLLCLGALAKRESGGAGRVATVIGSALQIHDSGRRFTARDAGELLVFLEYGPQWIRGEADCKQPSDPADLLALAALQAQDIHKYTMDDITHEQRVIAAKKELGYYDKYEVWHESTPEFITDENAIPKHAIKVSSTYVERPKLAQKHLPDGSLSKERELICKGRLCSRGFEVAGFWGARTDAPTISRPAFLIFLSICLWMGFDFFTGDISGAFLNGLPFSEKKVLYMLLPKILYELGLTPSAKCWRRLRKGPYGLDDVPRAWYRRMAKFLKSLGFQVSLLEPCLFFLWTGGELVCVVVLYVDDLFAGGLKAYLTFFAAELDKEFDMGMVDTASVDALTWTTEYTGRTLTFTRSRADQPWEKCTIEQHAYIRDKLGPAQVSDMRKCLDASRGSAKFRADRLLTPAGCETYRSLVGALMWAVQTNPEVGETASELAGGLQCPTAADATFLVKTLEHMHADPGSIVLHRLFGSRLDVLSFADSSLNNRGAKTQGGDCEFLVGSDLGPDATGAELYDYLRDWSVKVNPINVVSQGLSRVANSSFDGETLALDKATTSSVFYGHCVDEYVQGRPRSLEARAFFGGPDATVPVSRKTRVLQLSDGQGTVKAVTTTKLTQRNKRRATDLAGLKEHFAEDGSGDFLGHIPDPRNLADCLTKRCELKSEPVQRLRVVVRGAELVVP